MKKNWVHRLALWLVLCLVVNNCITNDMMPVHAAEETMTVPTASAGDIVEEAAEVPREPLIQAEPLALGEISAISLPKTREELLQRVGAGVTSFYLMSYEDLLLVEEYCQHEDVNGFAGIRLIFGEETGRETNDGYNWRIHNTDFAGIGTADHPFKGEIQHYFNEIVLTMKTPLLKYAGDGANIHDLNLKLTGGCAAIAENVADPDGSAVVSIADVTISLDTGGSIKNNAGAAGGIAAHIADNSILSLTNVTGTALKVEGAQAGGIAGTVGNGVTVTLGEGVSLSVAVVGKESAGGHFGTVTGDAVWSLKDESEGKLTATVKSNDKGCYSGQFAGKLLYAAGSGEEAELNIMDGTDVQVKLSGTGNGGGLVGFLGNRTKITKSEEKLTITGSVNMEGLAGGVTAVMENASMELSGYHIGIEFWGKHVGGIAGEIRGGAYIVRDIRIDKGYQGNEAVGGIAGRVTDSAAVELQGSLEFADTNDMWGWSAEKTGWVVGIQEESLIYFAGVEGILEDGRKQLITPERLGEKEEIGTYGGVYRNQTVEINGAEGRLIGDGTLEHVGVINNSIARSGEDYVLTCAADFETLAIALGTSGAYGMINGQGEEIFEGAAAASDAVLLAGSYLIAPASGNEIDISYEKTGIVTINRNDREDDAHAFSGKMKGADSGVTVLQNSSVRQERVGLFSTLGGNVEFSDLTIAGTVENAMGAGGLAYQSIGSGLTLTNITMERSITMQKSQDGDIAAVGGVLALAEGTEKNPFMVTAEAVVLANDITTVKVTESSGFIANLKNARVSMKDITLGGSFHGTNTGNSGGFLGYKWEKVGGRVENISVTDGTTYQSDGLFGGLISTLTTASGERLTLKNTDLAKLTVAPATKSTLKSKCSLLVQNAKKAILEVIDYSAAGCVVNKPGEGFDEIAGETRESSDAFVQSGIVSIHSTAEGYYPAYHYENQASYSGSFKKSEARTMYFYDVFQRLENADGTVKIKISSDRILDSVEEMLIWDILHYAHDEKVWETINQRYVESPYGAYKELHSEQYTFGGRLDLSQISFYPVREAGGSYEGDGSAVIAFGAAGLESWTPSNEDRTSQHYGLQAGLFADVSHQLTVNSLTLTGEVANLGTASGALVCGEEGLISGGNLLAIDLEDLWVNGYGGECEAIGLLISKIPGGSVRLDGIHMDRSSYPSAESKKAAAALIGSAGGEAATDLTLNFHDMIVADDRDDRAGDGHNGKILGYASFLFDYQYTDDASINKGYGLYLFSQEDNRLGKVTYGEELDFETEFSDNSYKVFTEGTDSDPSTIYKPYVYRIKDIEVNPKSGDILMGCGTYDDPYIISDYKQLLTLYRYMNETGTDYERDFFYKSWKVIKPGNDETVCEHKHAARWDAAADVDNDGVAEGGFVYDYAEHEGAALTFGEEGFPTPDDMSRAYYRLAADIDLSDIKSSTYKPVAQEFVGFGTKERPFVGVWYGKVSEGASDDRVYTITLPVKSAIASYETYGFIQYAKGAVVKDLCIKTKTDAAHTPTQIKNMGGGVIACILGGDNIIDNVTLDVTYRVAEEDAAIGGYVGNIRKGGLILRNVSNTALKNFSLDMPLDAQKYELIGAVAGKVEDGYLLYEGSGDTLNTLWTQRGGNTEYPQVSNYTALNGDMLKADCGNVTVQRSGVVDNRAEITITIPTAAALQVMSMALNADALNIRPSDYEDYADCGYTELSRSRKAKYSDIGCNTPTEDYVRAAKYDNIMNYTADGYIYADKAFAYPYLYQYLNLTGETYLDYLETDNYSILNPGIVINNTAYLVEWKLAEAEEYDMSRFAPAGEPGRSAFRGLGALYYPAEGLGGVFHGNFDGGNSTIKLNMIRNLLGPEDTSAYAAVQRVGLFNALYTRDNALYTVVEDFKESAEGVSELQGCAVIKNFVLTGSVTTQKGSSSLNVAGIAGALHPKAMYLFENITIKEMQITGKDGSVKETGNVGGFIAEVMQTENSHVLFRNCKVQGTADNPVLIRGHGNVGGFIGSSMAWRAKFENVDVDYLTAECEKYNVGALIGWALGYRRKTIVEGTGADPCSIQNTMLYANERVGGIVGGAETNLLCNYVSVEKLVLSANNEIGGIAGGVQGWDYHSIIRNVTVQDVRVMEKSIATSNISGIGGIVGKNMQKLLTIESAAVRGTKDESGDYEFRLHALYNKVRGASHGTGGLVGVHIPSGGYAATLSLKDCTVDTISISSSVKANASKNEVAAGGFVGYVKDTVILSGDMETLNLQIEVPLSDYATLSVMAAGGGFGAIVGKASLTGPSDVTYYDGMTATGNTIAGKQAGGIIGYVGNQTNVRLTGIRVQDGSISSDEAAGGVAGYIAPGSNGSAIGGTSVSTVANMQISGRQAGGIFGVLDVNGPFFLKNFALTGNSIVGRQTTKQREDGVDCSAGGIIGACAHMETWYYYSGNATRFYQVKLKDNTIAVEITGETALGATVLSDGEAEHVAAGGIIGRLWEEKAVTLTDIVCDNITIEADNRIGIRKAGTEAVMLVRRVSLEGETKYALSDLTEEKAADMAAELDSPQDYQLLGELEKEFGCYVGNVMGVAEADSIQFYLLRTEDGDGKPVMPVLSANPPVADVGRKAEQGVNDYRQYCHIIYGAPKSVAENAVPTQDSTVSCLMDMKAEVEAAASSYTAAEGMAVLQEYSLSETAIEKFNQVYRESFTFAEGMKLDFPVLVYKTEYGTLQEVMEQLVNIMTNVAGDSAGDISEDYLQITAEQWLYHVSEKSASLNPDGNASVKVERKDGKTQYSFTDRYDGLQGENALSFTVLTFRYGWSLDGGHYKVFRLPIFVEEPILHTVHTRLVEGRAADLSDIRQNGYSEGSSINMANDSDYSLLIEYTYGRARENMPPGSSVEKVIYLTPPSASAESGVKTFTKGTRMILIDASRGNRAYYYTVEDNNTSELKFTDFTDSSGKNYVNRSIHEIPGEGVAAENGMLYTDLSGHELSNVGVDRFLLTVISPDGVNNTNELYDLHIGMDIEDESLKARFYLAEGHDEEAIYQISAFPGLKISYDYNGNLPKVDISGTISRDGGLQIDAVARIQAPGGYYWAKKQAGENGNIIMIDSSSSGKYLEFAFYLRDAANENRVRFPDGTNFSYEYTVMDENGKEKVVHSDTKVIPNDVVFYFYKDIRDTFEEEDWEYDISRLEGDTTTDIHFKFDFSGADMSDITEENYYAWLDLLRASDKDYPMSNGNVYDRYFKSITANATSQLGFAIKAVDMSQLAINTYPTPEESDVIDYRVMFDFSQILKQENPTAKENMLNLWASYDYRVTYRVQQKTENGYVDYTGSDIRLLARETVEGSGELVDSNSLTVLYRFDSEERKELLKQNNYLEFPCQVVMDTEKLTADYASLTNYRIVAVLEVMEPGSAAAPAETTEDFFVYTITKLKFDL